MPPKSTPNQSLSWLAESIRNAESRRSRPLMYRYIRSMYWYIRSMYRSNGSMYRGNGQKGLSLNGKR